MTQEVLKLALEALDDMHIVDFPLEDLRNWNKAITAIKEALAKEKALQALHNENERLGLYKDAYAEQEPVAWATKEDFYRELKRELKHIREEMKIKSVTMRCKDYDIALPIIDTHFGRVLVGQVSTPPQRTWVGLTNKERADCWETIPELAMRKVEAKLKEKNT